MLQFGISQANHAVWKNLGSDTSPIKIPNPEITNALGDEATSRFRARTGTGTPTAEARSVKRIPKTE